MHGLDDQPPSDLATHAAVRARLLLYMQQNRIGAPRLARRIGRAARQAEFPLKTLQNFLAGRHRLNDASFGMLKNFIATLPPASDPIDELGKALQTLFKAPVTTDFAGDYRDKAGQTLVIESTSDFFKIKLDLTPESEFSDSLYDGVMVPTAVGAAFSVLRSRLFGQPRSYAWLMQEGILSAYNANLAHIGTQITRIAHPIFRFAKLERKDCGPASRPPVADHSNAFEHLEIQPHILAMNRHPDISPEEFAITSVLNAAKRGEMRTLEYFQQDGMLKTVINATDNETGMTALHIAVGTDNLKLARYLLEHGATFVADGFGRWPSTIAARCEVSTEMNDFIVEAEAAAGNSGESDDVTDI